MALDMEKALAIALLEQQVHVANRLYYDDPDNATLSDRQFDNLVNGLKKMCPDSPVLNERSNYDRDIQHTRLVGSWDKCHTVEEVLAHFKKGSLLSATPKIDGMSLTLYYEDHRLRLAATRGDTTTGKGKDITANACCIQDLPPFIRIPGKVEVKGEAFIPKTAFYGVMDKPGYGGKKEGLSNPRNAAAGGVMAKNPNETLMRRVHFVAYGLVTDDKFAQPDSHAVTLDLLRDNGFVVPRYQTVKVGDAQSLQSVIDAIGEAGQYPFEIDGVVLIYDSFKEFEKAGVSGVCPQGGLAYKFATETATTQLLDIEWSALRTGKVRPRGRVKPVTLGGSTVEYLTLNNKTWLIQTGVAIGDTIDIKKANEIIPTFVRIVSKGTTRRLPVPTTCPCCDSELVTRGADLYCDNSDCPAKTTEATLNMLQKLDVKGIGPEFIDKMAEGGLLETPDAIFNNSQEALMQIGFGAGQARNIVDAVSNLTVTKVQQLAALGIPGWGRRLFTHLFENSDITYEDLITYPLKGDVIAKLREVKGIGATRATVLIDGLSNKRTMLASIRFATNLAPETKAKATKKATACTGKKFCITGTLSKPRTDIQQSIFDAGGIPVDSVSKATDYLVAGDKAGSKIDKAKKLGVTVLTEEQLEAMLK